jgi:predicted dehydrogenase
VRSLIIGLGFGNTVYFPILKSLGHEVITVDPIKPALFSTIEEAIDKYKFFTTVNIATPNYTHEALARQLAPHCKFIFVEKPGFINKQSWHKLVIDFPDTNILMTKNNQYRKEIDYYRHLAKQSKNITVKWSNNNRIPNPGTWFTNKKLAYGGVSRDLMPHLLSYYTLFDSYESGICSKRSNKQVWNLDDLKSTEYGIVDTNGVFDVDTYYELEYQTANTKWTLIADWKSNKGFDEIYIDFDGKRFELGLCPEEAYKRMIQTVLLMNDKIWYWEDQLAQDLFIHKEIEFE